MVAHVSSGPTIFDRHVGKASKGAMKLLTPLLRDTPGLVKTVDQWALLLLAVSAEHAQTGEKWRQSFIDCNLHPHFQLPMEQWLLKLNAVVGASSSIRPDGDDGSVPVEPEFLQGVTEKDKLLNFLACNGDGQGWDADFMLSVNKEYGIAIKDMPHLFQYVNALKLRNQGPLATASVLKPESQPPKRPLHGRRRLCCTRQICQAFLFSSI